MLISGQDDARLTCQGVAGFLDVKVKALTFSTRGRGGKPKFCWSQLDPASFALSETTEHSNRFEVPQNLWELRLAQVDSIHSVQVVTRGGEETLGDICEHILDEVSTRGVRKP